MDTAISQLVNDFVTKVRAVAESDCRERAIVRLGGTNGVHKPKEPIKATTLVKRRKGPVQLCPHPGCKERSAPVFNMTCAKHKNDKKSDIKKWREARRKKTVK